MKFFAMVFLGALAWTATVHSQPAANKKGAEKKFDPLPNDTRLLALHRRFVLEAEKLANEYERSNQHDKAAAVYGEILKLVPAYPKARSALEKIQQRELTANRVVLDILANKAWQDTGVRVIEGKTLVLTAEGTWEFRMSEKVGPEGMQIPEALREFPLGSLIGMVTGGDPKKLKPFLIGSKNEFIPEWGGRLLVRMHDSDAEDNQGRMKLNITGRFEH